MGFDRPIEQTYVPDHLDSAITEKGLAQVSYCEATLTGEDISKLIMNMGRRKPDDPKVIVADLISGLTEHPRWDLVDGVIFSPEGTIWQCWRYEDFVHLNLAFQTFAYKEGVVRVIRKTIYDPKDVDRLILERQLHQAIYAMFADALEELGQEPRVEVRTLYPTVETLVTTEVSLPDSEGFRAFVERVMKVNLMEVPVSPKYEKCPTCWFRECTSRARGLIRASKPAIERPFEGVNIQRVGLE